MIRAAISLDAIAVPCPYGPVLEALRIFNGALEWSLPDAGWLPGVDRQLAPPTCECSVITFPVTRGFCFAEHDEPGAVPAIVHVVYGPDAQRPIGLAAWCEDQPTEVFQYPDNLPCLGLDQLDNPASYFAGAALPIHRTPLAWLAGGCRGIVVLDADALWRVLYELPELPGGYALGAEDLGHALALEANLDPLPEHVQILVPVL